MSTDGHINNKLCIIHTMGYHPALQRKMFLLGLQHGWAYYLLNKPVIKRQKDCIISLQQVSKVVRFIKTESGVYQIWERGWQLCKMGKLLEMYFTAIPRCFTECTIKMLKMVTLVFFYAQWSQWSSKVLFIAIWCR